MKTYAQRYSPKSKTACFSRNCGRIGKTNCFSSMPNNYSQLDAGLNGHCEQLRRPWRTISATIKLDPGNKKSGVLRRLQIMRVTAVYAAAVAAAGAGRFAFPAALRRFKYRFLRCRFSALLYCLLMLLYFRLMQFDCCAL